MRSTLLRGALAGLALTLLAPAAMAAHADMFLQIDGLTIRKAGGHDLLRVGTDAKGRADLGTLPPGDYELLVDGKSLVAAMDRLAPPPPPKQSGGGASLSIGGLLGGGGSGHSSGHQGIGDGPKDDKHRDERGLGVGVDIPLGGGQREDKIAVESYHFFKVELTGILVSSIRKAGANSGVITLQAPICRDSAAQGIRIGFTIPDQASAGNLAAPVGVVLGISDEGLQGNLTSY